MYSSKTNKMTHFYFVLFFIEMTQIIVVLLRNEDIILWRYNLLVCVTLHCTCLIVALLSSLQLHLEKLRIVKNRSNFSVETFSCNL